MHTSGTSLSRRSLLAGGALLAGSAALGLPVSARDPVQRKRVLRFAHPTDIHVQPELRGSDGMAACFRHMMGLQDPPSMIITGGDLPMDTASTPFDRSQALWNLFQRILRDEVSANIRIHHTLGNHDVFGRKRDLSKATGSEPQFGKRWFLDNFGYTSTYRHFDAAGWKFIILDSIDLLANGDDFVGRISGPQLDWLRQTLKETPATTPIVIISHVPIMSVANYFDKDESPWQSDWDDIKFPASRMHVDCRDLDALFRSHGNVKLALSGHLHLLDRCVYNGTTYICDGAVSGAKWKGAKRETVEGYGLIDLYDDGSFEHTYQSFGWQAKVPTKTPASQANAGPA